MFDTIDVRSQIRTSAIALCLFDTAPSSARAQMKILSPRIHVLRESTASFRERCRSLCDGASGVCSSGCQRRRSAGGGRTAGTEDADDVSFAVAPGTFVAVVGASGSGKSSLTRLLFRLYEPSSGRITLDGVPLQELSLSAVRRAIAIVPQDIILFHETIAANIALGRHGATQADIEDAARTAALHEFILSLPEGYCTLVGERGMKLSGGERQLIAIARAALKRPRIFVCDEATSSLDSHSEGTIIRNLTKLTNQCTTLVIAHRLSTVIHADKILVLHGGSIVERGTHPELLARKGHYADLWSAQQADKANAPSSAIALAH